MGDEAERGGNCSGDSPDFQCSYFTVVDGGPELRDGLESGKGSLTLCRAKNVAVAAENILCRKEGHYKGFARSLARAGIRGKERSGMGVGRRRRRRHLGQNSTPTFHRRRQ